MFIIVEVDIELSGRVKFKSNLMKLVLWYEFVLIFGVSRWGCEGINNLVVSVLFVG